VGVHKGWKRIKMTDKPNIEIDFAGTMRRMGDNVSEEIGNKYGFMILVFPFNGGSGSAAHYISNANREDMIKVLREKADVLEAKGDICTDS